MRVGYVEKDNIQRVNGDVMRYKLNSDGFTLIELLAVFVILIAIIGIAIPSISSSVERSKVKQDEARKKVLESAASLFVNSHKNDVYNYINSSKKCCILLSDLIDDDLVTNEEILRTDDTEFDGYILFDMDKNSYKYMDGSCDLNIKCLLEKQRYIICQMRLIGIQI